MPESTQLLFDLKELATMLVKKEGIHEGDWCVLVKFGIGGVTMTFGDGTYPTALVPMQKIGIQKLDEPNAISVNAAEVNPLSPGPVKGSKKGAKK